MDILELEDNQLVYLAAAMLITFVLQYFVSRHSKRKRLSRIIEAMTCQILTISLSVPMLEFFPTWPPSSVMIVGAVMGVLGVDEWEKVAHGVVAFIFQHITGHNFHFIHLDHPYQEEDDEEPPLPIRKKKDDSRRE